MKELEDYAKVNEEILREHPQLRAIVQRRSADLGKNEGQKSANVRVSTPRSP
jgi:hypothetical protein